jgi:hypothetical protein
MRLGNIVNTGNWKGRMPLIFVLAASFPVPVFANCGPPQLEAVRVQHVSKEGDIFLSDSRRLRLAGLHLVKPAAVQRLKAGETINIGLLGQTVDRWSRLPALVFTGNQNQQEWLQERLIRDGVALARPEEGLEDCWPLLTGIERNLAAKTVTSKVEGGRFARVEGRVQRVSDGRTAKFISVEGPHGERVAGMILKRHLKRFSDNDIDVDKLRGQTIRIRGVRNIRNASIISLLSVDQIEIIR